MYRFYNVHSLYTYIYKCLKLRMTHAGRVQLIWAVIFKNIIRTLYYFRLNMIYSFI